MSPHQQSERMELYTLGRMILKFMLLMVRAATKSGSLRLEGYVRTSPAIGPYGNIYIGSNDSYFYSLDGETGEKRWGFGPHYTMDPSPVIGIDGTVYYSVFSWDNTRVDNNGNIKNYNVHGVASVGNKIYALDYKTGVEKWAFKIGDGYESEGMWDTTPAIGSDGILYFVTFGEEQSNSKYAGSLFALGFSNRGK